MNPAALITILLLAGCNPSPVLKVGDPNVRLKNHRGTMVVDAPNSVYREIRYRGFGFDWNENDGFLIRPEDNSPDRALWGSILRQKDKNYTVLFFAEKQPHYLQKADIELLREYMKHAYRANPASKIKLLKLTVEECKFKDRDAVEVYMETFEAGRELYLLAHSLYFFDPVQPERFIYHLAWSERGKKKDWRSPEAEKQGKRFFESFKLLPKEERK